MKKLLSRLVVLQALFYFFAFSSTFAQKQKTNTYHGIEIGWTIDIPNAWQIVEQDIRRDKNRPDSLVHENTEVFEFWNIKLLEFQKDPNNYFYANITPKKTSLKAHFRSNKRNIKKAFEEMGVSYDIGKTSTETIGHLEFYSFQTKIKHPEMNITQTQLVFGTYINNMYMQVVFCTSTKKNYKQLLKIWRNSTFQNFKIDKKTFYKTVDIDSANNYSFQLFDESGNSIFDKTYDDIDINNWYYIITEDKGSKKLHFSNAKEVPINNIQDVRTVWSSSIYLPVMKDSLWGFYTRKGKLAIEHQYQNATCFSNGVAAVKKNGDTYYIDVRGNKIDKKYQEHYRFEFFNSTHNILAHYIAESWKYKEFESKGKKGLMIKETSEVILKAEYDDFYDPVGNKITVRKNNKSGVMDLSTGKTIIPIEYNDIFVMD